jgi:hypothetical protein
MHRPAPRLAATIALAAALGGLGGMLALAAPAGAAGTTATTGTASHPTCTPATVVAAQQQLEAALAGRVTVLGSLSGDVQAATGLAAADRATLTATLATTSAGIGALVQKAPTDTTCLALWQDARSMVQSYRVYAVVAPQTHLAIAGDTADGIEATLAGDEPAIQGAIATAGKNGVNTAAAQASFADLQAQVTAAQGATGGVSATVLAQTPASYPGSSPVFVAARDGVRTAYGDLKTAAADLQAIVADLR